jgi:predicted dehydrogenase
MTGESHSFVLIGLGEIGLVHLAALADIRAATVVAAVDTMPATSAPTFRGRSLPVLKSLRQIGYEEWPDFAVVATPTPTHMAVVTELIEQTPPTTLILVEKPLCYTRGELDQYRRMSAETRNRIGVLYHAAFASDVREAERLLPWVVAEHGPVRRFSSFFFDPYSALPASRRNVYVSSWLDSGINALSILERLLGVEKVGQSAQVPALCSAYAAAVETGDGAAGRASGMIYTSWQAAGGVKRTELEFGDGAEVRIEHTALALEILIDSKLQYAWGAENAAARQVDHYRNLYQAIWSKEYNAMDADRDLRLHQMLLSAVD